MLCNRSYNKHGYIPHCITKSSIKVAVSIPSGTQVACWDVLYNNFVSYITWHITSKSFLVFFAAYIKPNKGSDSYIKPNKGCR